MEQNELYDFIADFFQKLQNGDNEIFKKHFFELLDKILSDKETLQSLLKKIMDSLQICMYETNNKKIIEFLNMIRFLIMANGMQCHYKNYKYPIFGNPDPECDTLAVTLNNGTHYEISIKKVV